MCRCWDLSVDSVFDPLRDRGSREGCLTSLSTFHRFPDINRGKKLVKYPREIFLLWILGREKIICGIYS